MKNTYILSDTHIGHVNIIKYAKRPFIDLDEMNNTIIDNWNKIVKQNDRVYFLGDLALKVSAEDLKKNLNGDITFIRGNHDKNLKAIDFDKLNYREKDFLLSHLPNSFYNVRNKIENFQFTWDGWVIHGHHHNHHPEMYPLINGSTKTINVSVELINYKPLNLDYLFDIDFESIKYLKSLDSEIVRF